MKLFPPEPEISLYETGFGGDDPFNRIGTGRSLSELVERIEDPLVIALDGGWGSGKTWFLRRWVGAHGRENGGRATTVYFDAFAHDFMDDPLIALTGVIGDRLPGRAEGRVWARVKTAAAKLAKPVARIGLALATGGATEIAGPIVDAAVEATSKELEVAAEAFWSRENGKRAAMQQLRSALVELTMAPAGKDTQPTPLVVVVDELDRCRPDYALALLETIKHFFSVPNVHFILGVNLAALGHSVRVRYGSAFEAERYLRRFISISMRLPDQLNDHSATRLVTAYFNAAASAMGIHTNAVESFERHIKLMTRLHSPTMRDVNHILSSLALTNPEIYSRYYWGWQEIATSMILFKTMAPALEREALTGDLELRSVLEFYSISPAILSEIGEQSHNSTAKYISDLWEFVTSNGARPVDTQEDIYKAFDRHRMANPRDIPRTISKKFLEAFSFTSATGR